MTNATDTISTWTLDAAHSTFGFSVRHMMITTVRGQFSSVSGQLELNGEDPTQSAISLEIETASIGTGNEQRDAHLRSADFFDAENHPKITFVSSGIRATGDDTYDVTGALTIRGVTREVVVKVEEEGRGIDPWGQSKIAYTASTKIRRTDYGLNWNQALEAGGVLVAEEVKIEVELQATQA
jgi:polyisoprenoid-binding protein YceI